MGHNTRGESLFSLNVQSTSSGWVPPSANANGSSNTMSLHKDERAFLPLGEFTIRRGESIDFAPASAACFSWANPCLSFKTQNQQL